MQGKKKKLLVVQSCRADWDVGGGREGRDLGSARAAGVVDSNACACRRGWRTSVGDLANKQSDGSLRS